MEKIDVMLIQSDFHRWLPVRRSATRRSVKSTQRGQLDDSHLSARRPASMHQLNDWAWPSNIDQLVPKTICTPRPDRLRDTRPDIMWSIPACPSARAMLIYVAMMLSVEVTVQRFVRSLRRGSLGLFPGRWRSDRLRHG